MSINFKEIIGAGSGEPAKMLGKFLYFSLSNILVDKETLSDLCDNMGLPYSGGKRVSVSDAFRSATGDIKDRITTKGGGELRIYQIYCRHYEQVLRRELDGLDDEFSTLKFLSQELGARAQKIRFQKAA